MAEDMRIFRPIPPHLSRRTGRKLTPHFLALAAGVLLLASAAARSQSVANLLAASVPAKPATMELILPAGTAATVDGRDVGAERTITFDQFGTNSSLMVKVSVVFADASKAERSVELFPGRRVRVPINRDPVDRPVAVVTDSPVPVLWASFSADGQRLATAAESGYVEVWDLQAGRPVCNFPGHSDAVQSVVFSPDGERLLTSSTDGTAIIWNARTGQILQKLKGHTNGVNSAVFSGDGRRVVTGSTDTSAILWDAATGTQIRAFQAHTNDVVAVAISPDGHRVATASADRLAYLWNADTGEKLFKLAHRDTVAGLSFSSDGARLAAASFENNAYIWDVATGKNIGMTRRVNLDINAVAFSPDDRRIYTAGKDATAKMWDAQNFKQLREFTGHSTDLQSVAPSPDGQLLLTSSRDGTCRLYDVATGVELCCLASGNNGRNWAVVTPDGLFDASEPGRQIMGYRFAGKLPGASIDQFFGRFYQPGLLARLTRGERLLADVQLGSSVPPQLKIVGPKIHAVTDEEASVAVDALDAGNGVSNLAVYDNGARRAVKPESTREGNTVHYTFKVHLARGSNRLRVTATSSDGSWESMPAEVELNGLRPPDRKSRLFVVAVGAGGDARGGATGMAGDAQALGELLRQQSATLFDRVDVIPLMGRQANRGLIGETLQDVAALTKPQDALVLVFCGRGNLIDGHVGFLPQPPAWGTAKAASDQEVPILSMDEVVEWLGRAAALRRVLILDAVDASGPGTEGARDFALRGNVERWSRAQGIYVMASLAPGEPGTNSRGLLSRILLDAAGRESGMAAARGFESADGAGAVNVREWFDEGARRAGPVLERLGLDSRHVQQSTQTKSFPLLVVGR